MKKNIVNFAKKYWWINLTVVGLIVYILAMLLSYGQSVWFDEGYSILLAKQNFGELFALTAVDAHPPFYYLLLKIWGDTFGFSEFALRTLSAIFAAGSVVVTYLLTKKLFGWKIAAYSLPFIILAPFLLRYAYEIRMYSLAMFIGVVGTYVLVLARESRKVLWWAIYATLVALGMFTLYMTLVVWLAHLVWQIILSLHHKLPIRKWKWLWAYVAAVGLFMPYLPTFIHQLTNSALPGIGNEITLTTIVDIVTVLTTYTPQWATGGWLSLLILALVVGLVATGIKVFGSIKQYKINNQGMLLLVLLATVPMIFYIIISLPPSNPIFVVRYLAHVSIWIYLLVGVALAVALVKAGRKNKSYDIIAALTLAVFTIGIVTLMLRGNYIFERNQTPMTQQMKEELSVAVPNGCSGDVTVVADDPYTYIDTAYYFDKCNLKFYSKDDVEKKGGYAPLHGSDKRLNEPDLLKSKYIAHIHWGQPEFKPGEKYKLVSETIYDKQLLSLYQLNAE